jgi:hypothetical protein
MFGGKKTMSGGFKHWRAASNKVAGPETMFEPAEQ